MYYGILLGETFSNGKISAINASTLGTYYRRFRADLDLSPIIEIKALTIDAYEVALRKSSTIRYVVTYVDLAE